MEIDRWDIVIWGLLIGLIITAGYFIALGEIGIYQNGIPCNVSSDCKDFCIKSCISQNNDTLKAYYPNCYKSIWGNVCGRCRCEYWEGWRPYEK
jgi:hypothetical protein